MLSIIIPTYNEADNINNLIESIVKCIEHIDSYEILIVDDNSPDKTGEIVREYSKKNPNIKVMVRTKDRGLAKSVVDGYKNAKGDYLLVMDADLSHPPEIIPKLYYKIKEGFDVVVASRLVEGGGTEDWPRTRRLNSFVGTFLCRPLTKVKDPMSGFYIIRKDLFLDFNKIKTEGYKILLEVLVKSKSKKTAEVPFIFRDRTYGNSKLNFMVNLQYVKQLIRLYFWKMIH